VNSSSMTGRGGVPPSVAVDNGDGDGAARALVSAPVYELLRAGIISGDYAPGSRLVETQLAQAFGVSRTPIRAALARLEGDGLVESAPNKGSFVAGWAESEFEEIYALRIRLEPYAANLAAGRMDPAEVVRLDALATRILSLAESEEEGWTETCAQLDSELHSTIVAASQSPRLIAMVSNLSEQPLIRRAISLLPRDVYRSTFEQHHQILHAVARGDGELAETLMRAHIMGARHSLRQHGSSSTWGERNQVGLLDGRGRQYP
jgi:DNA-binding GntR family transcriptional regulator